MVGRDEEQSSFLCIRGRPVYYETDRITYGQTEKTVTGARMNPTVGRSHQKELWSLRRGLASVWVEPGSAEEGGTPLAGVQVVRARFSQVLFQLGCD